MPVQRYGKTFWPNDEVSGVHIEFTHLSADEHPNGGEHKFGIKVVLPASMHDAVDWEKAKEDTEYRRSFASGSLMMHVDAMEKTLAMHPDCVEVTDFYGIKHDVSDIGLDQMLHEMLEGTAREQYEEEKARGIVPTGMSFDEWCEIAAPDAGMDLTKWDPNGKAN
jgi:hypothetical protein